MYLPMGYYEVDKRRLMVKYCREIATKDWERDLLAVVKPIHGSRMISSVRGEDLAMLKGEGRFGDGTQQLRKLIWLLLAFFEAIGNEAVHVPKVAGYRTKPDVNIDEAVELVIASRAFMPTAADLALDTKNRVSGVWGVFMQVVRRIAAVARDADRVLKGIRTHLCDVAYRKSRRMPITDYEKSLLLCYGTAGLAPGAGNTAEERTSGKLPPLSPAEHDSDIVLRIWDEVQRVVECGPHSKFYSVVSNGDRNELILAVSPHASTLTFVDGYPIAWGFFDEIIIDGTRSVQWDRDAALLAAQETGVAFNASDKPFQGVEPQRVGTTSANFVQFSFDEMGVDFDVDQKARKGEMRIHLNNYQYRDTWLNRLVSSDNGASPAQLAYSRCLDEKDWGGAQAGMLDMSTFGLIDTHETDLYMGGREYKRALKSECRALIPKLGSPGELEEFTVDLRTVQKGHGDIEFLPAFLEFTQFPRKELFVENKEEEALAIMQANLSRERALQAALGIRISMNYYRAIDTIGPKAFVISERELKYLVQTVSTRRVINKE